MSTHSGKKSPIFNYISLLLLLRVDPFGYGRPNFKEANRECHKKSAFVIKRANNMGCAKIPWTLPGPKVIKLFPSQLYMKFYSLINNELLVSTFVLLLSLAE